MMRWEQVLETILVVLLMVVILMALLGTLLVLEIVNFIVGQPMAWTYKFGTLLYLGMTFLVVSYVAAKKIYRVMHTG